MSSVDPRGEINFLDCLNEQVAGVDDVLFPQPKVSKNAFIVGAPRSGTTLLSQVMAYAFDVGYINNVAATYWQAPALGVLYGNRLVQKREFIAASNYGMTENLSEPHEFGGFWRSRLQYENLFQKRGHSVDWQQLLKALDQIGAAWQKTMFYKVFQLTWHLIEFDRLRPQTKWIWVKRNLSRNVTSLLRLAEKRQEIWTSAVPLEAMERFANAPHWQQVTAQVELFNQWIEHQFESVESERIKCVSLESLIANPTEEIHGLGEFLGLAPLEGSIETISKRLRASDLTDIAFERQVNEFTEQVVNRG